METVRKQQSRIKAIYLILFLAATFVFANEPVTREPLTTADVTALEEPIALGHRILGALSKYLQASSHTPSYIRGDHALLTRTPTIELLHAVGCLSDSDFALSRSYYATLHPVPPDCSATQPVLTMSTDRGELVFAIGGEVMLEGNEPQIG